MIMCALAGIGLLFSFAPWNATAETSIVQNLASRQVSYEAAHGGFIGRVPYVYGGTSPYTGFDCSGFAQYLYAQYAGVQIPRVADDQFAFFRPETQTQAWGGDLVFFHSGSIDGPVYHTGIYEGGDYMVSALDGQYGIMWTPISWGGSFYTFGTISH